MGEAEAVEEVEVEVELVLVLELELEVAMVVGATGSMVEVQAVENQEVEAPSSFWALGTVVGVLSASGGTVDFLNRSVFAEVSATAGAVVEVSITTGAGTFSTAGTVSVTVGAVMVVVTVTVVQSVT